MHQDLLVELGVADLIDTVGGEVVEAPAAPAPAPAPATGIYSTFDPFLIYTNGPNGVVLISSLPPGTQVNHAGYYINFGLPNETMVAAGVYTVPQPQP